MREKINGLSKSAAALLVGLLVAACASAPPRVEKITSVMLPQPQSSLLGASVAVLSHRYPDLSGHMVLDTGRQAFNARVALAGSAEQTLDAQYFIWNSDTTGKILAQQVLAAADRGVRVRLLLDDYGVGNKDKQLTALDAHEHIEVRVYNSFNAGFRSGLLKWANFALGFSRLNRRMHSKTFIVDNSIAITGGRNIGDEYFDANTTMNHRDRDLLSIGPVVTDISGQFDVMWNSEWSIPISALIQREISKAEQEQHYQRLEAAAEDDEILYPLPLAPDERDRLVLSLLQEAIWAPTIFVYNPPAITGGDESGGAVVADRLVHLLLAARSEVLIESAYFTVMDDMLARLAPNLGSSVKIKVVTNSLATTDVWTIHAGYTRNRKELLRQGVELFEWRGDGQSCATVIDNDKLDCGNFLYSLHAKSMVFDRETIFVGSFNLNPRSQLLNTETAMIVKSNELAARLVSDISRDMQPGNSWRLAIDDDGNLSWHGETEGKPEVVDHEPQTSTLTRFKSRLAAWLPLEKYW
jgi:putative cardiolipin synthase